MKPRLLLLALVLVVGCRKRSADPQTEAKKEDLDAAPRDAGPRDGGGPDGGPKAEKPKTPSIFSVVVEDPKLDLQRIPGGPVLGIDTGARAIYTLLPTGDVEPLAPISAYTVESTPPWLEMGVVAGAGDHVFLERVTFAGRAGTTTEAYVSDLGKKTTKKVHREGFVSAAFPWANGSTIAWETDSPSVFTAPGLTRGGRFFVVAGTPGRALPKLPAAAASERGDFVGYASGRIFARAGLRPKAPDEPVDLAYIWDFPSAGGAATAVKMPGEVTGLVQGREEKETLAYGNDWLARFDGQSWTKLDGAPEKVESASVADDGTVWLVADDALYRAETVGGAFTKVPLPDDASVNAVVARTRDDVWVTSGGTLLHTQAERPPKKLPENPDEFARVALAEKDPGPFGASCQWPYVSVAPEGEMTDADVHALLEKQPDTLDATPVISRLHSGNVVGLELPSPLGDDPQHAATVQAWFGKLRAKKPKAKLLCGRPALVREIAK